MHNNIYCGHQHAVPSAVTIGINPLMKGTKIPRPPVPGGPAIPGYDSGLGHGGAGGAKNLRQRFGCQRSKRTLHLATYNTRTLRTDEKIKELEEEVGKLKWNIIGLSEVRRQGEDTVILKSGNLFYHREGEHLSQGGIGFLVHRSLVNNVTQVESVSARVAYLILRISERYSLKVIQVYAPTSTHPDDEVEAMYEDVSRAIHASKTHFTVVMGDFNARLGKRDGDEQKVGPFGFGQRNHRGHMLADFLEKENLFMMNSFFKKKPQRRWTWVSPSGSTKSEIDFILTDKRHIFNDVSVINRVKTGSDHRMVRGTLNINIKLERSRLMKSTLRPTPVQIQGSENFQLELQNRFADLELCTSVDSINKRVVQIVHESGSKFFKTPSSGKPQELSEHTLGLMKERRELCIRSPSSMFKYRQLNKQISCSRRRDLRALNARRVETIIERNQGSKVFTRNLSIGQSQLTRLKTESGAIVSSKPEIQREIERYYGRLYTSSKPLVPKLMNDKRAKLTRHYTEDIPDVSLYEIRGALNQLKNNKAPGDDGITAELLKAGGKPLLLALQKMFDTVISSGTVPEEWSRSVVVLFFKKGDRALLKNYRPIALLSHIYKLFSRVLTNRIARRLDDFQPPE